MEKRGLAVIYDPHNLYQFVWYYCDQKNAKKWDALCLPNGQMGEYMGDFCEKAEIFEDIYRYDDSYENMNFFGRINLFLKMLLYAAVKKQKNMCYGIVGKYVRTDIYDEIVVLTDSGIVSGACMGLGKDKKVVILEDGVSDTLCRNKRIQWEDLFNTYQLQGFILAKLGYACPGHHYVLKTSYDCIKYCSSLDVMKFKGYKEIRPLFDMTDIDEEQYNLILKKIYPQLDCISFNNYKAILFTSPIEDFTNEPAKYRKKICDYLENHYDDIMIKNHPRDKFDYAFECNKRICKVDQAIPAELLLPFIRNVDIYFMSYTTMAMYVKAYGYKISYFYFCDLYGECMKKNTSGKYYTEEEMEKFYYYWIGEGCTKIVI